MKTAGCRTGPPVICGNEGIMADWTDLPNSLFETGKPARGTDMRAMRDNMAAIAEGAEGAPSISKKALGSPVAGDILRFRKESAVSVASSGSTVALSATYLNIFGGSVRITFQVRKTGGAGNARAEVIVNGVQLYVVETGSTSYVNYSVDIPLESEGSGPLIVRLSTTASVGTSNSVYLNNLQLLTDDSAELWLFTPSGVLGPVF